MSNFRNTILDLCEINGANMSEFVKFDNFYDWDNKTFKIMGRATKTEIN